GRGGKRARRGAPGRQRSTAPNFAPPDEGPWQARGKRTPVPRLLVLLALLAACSPKPASPLPPVLTGKDGMKLLLVPAGPFLMGTEEGDDDERPAHMVTLPDFYIDQHPVTNA